MHVLDKHELRAFLRERADLLEAESAVNPFASIEWLDPFIEHVATDAWEFVVPEHLADGESLMLLYRPHRSAPSLAALGNYYASLYSPMVTSAWDRRAALAALVAQVDSLRPRVTSIRLSPIESGWADAISHSRCFGRVAWYPKRYFCFGNWYLPCGNLSFERYLEERPSRIRNTLARKGKKFEREGGRLELVTGEAGLDRAMAAYQAVYARSWKRPEPHPGFIPAWVRRCARNGWLRLGIAWHRDTPIAAQIWFTMNQKAHVFKLAYDEAFKPLSAGTLLTAFLMQHSLDVDRVAEVDYLTGDDDYKREWMAHRRVREGIVACNLATVRGACLAMREFAGSARQRLRRGAALPAPIAPVAND